MQEFLHRQQVRPHPNPRRIWITSSDRLQDGPVFPVRGG